MNIQYIEKESIMNGDGNRCVIWVSGCNHHCPGCHNPETWDLHSGHLMDNEDLNEIYRALDNPYIRGVTFSGGDPLHPANRKDVEALIIDIKEKYPNKTIWLYTGYEWEDIKDLPLIKYVDVVCVGEFILELLDVNYHWAGSTNQRVIDVKKTLKSGEVQLHK